MSVNVAIVGATGAVGQEFLTVLADSISHLRDLPAGHHQMIRTPRF